MERVNWKYIPRGGYGWSISIAAIVVKRNEKTVRIAVLNLRSQQIEYKCVKPENLTPREKHSELDDAYTNEQ